MAVDKLVDSTQLDSDLTSVANAIRTKGGTSASLSFPSGFVTAIGNISGGTDVSDTTATAGDVRTGKYFYTANGTKTQGTIADQAAQTITPTTSDQTIASGKYLTGTQTIKGDANLVAGNIKKNVTIFGVTGTHEGGTTPTGTINIQYNGTYDVTNYASASVSVAGGSTDNLKEFLETNFTSSFEHSTATMIGIAKFAYQSSMTGASFPACVSIGNSAFFSCGKLQTAYFPVCTSIGISAFYNGTSLATISFPSCITIGNYAFWNCGKISEAIFPNCTSIGTYAFQYAYQLDTISFPVCTTIGDSAFAACSKLTDLTFPDCTRINNYAFAGCRNFTTASFPVCVSIGSAAFSTCYSVPLLSFPSCTSIGSNAFAKCYNLISLYLLGSSVAQLWHSNAFTSTPIGGYTTSTGGVYGSIYVPASLLATYKASTNWTYFSARMVGV